jgi:3-oxoacyl-[acyl-carrier protein] reductase
MSEVLSGRTAIITGSSSGIGNAVATKLAAAGANVVITSRSEERAKDAAAELEATNSRAVGVRVDVTDPDSVASMVEATVEEFGGLDIMVNNAGTNIRGPAEEFDPADWQQVVDVNLSGVFYGSQAAARQMIAQGDGGHIVNVSSIMGEKGLHERAAYSASKGGVNNLTRTLAVEWAKHDIHVNAIAPGYIRTEMTDEALTDVGFTDEDVRNRTPLGRWGTPEEIANCVRFLVSGNHFVTGEILHADGGWLAFAWGSRGE